MTQSFEGFPFDVANLSYERHVDDARLDPPPGGWVNGLERLQEDVTSTQAHEWTLTAINNNHSQGGEQVAGYFQMNNSGNWGAAFVAEANGNPGSVTTVTAEFDGRNVAVGLNYVATGGDTGAAIRIDARPDATIHNALEITAHVDSALVVHGPGPVWLAVDPELQAGIALVGTGPNDAHIVAVASGHATQIV